jgi:catechol 2,3-dioxygenase-like lactoylglutathione lyase family enzyme
VLRKLDRVILRVPSLANAVRYYQQVLKLNLIRHETHVASFHLAGGGELVLHDDETQPFEQVCFLVDDVRDLYLRREELKLTFVQSPQQVSRGFKAAVKDPFGTVLLILDRTTDAAASDVIEDAKPPEQLFPGPAARLSVKEAPLIEIYCQVGLTADDLPYTPQFERLHSTYAALQGDQLTRGETWRHLLNLRKAGKLPKLGVARSEPPELDPAALVELKNLIGPHMGRRDRLPYTEQFDHLVDEFNRTLPRPLSPHLVWRVVARLAK